MIVPTALNGRIPEATLGTLPGLDGDGTPHRANANAVQAYGRLRSRMQAAGLGDLLPSPGYSCYRTLADQAHMRALGLTSVAVGRSLHGEALAVDFAGLSGARLAWMRANAAQDGWYQPTWAIRGIFSGGKMVQAPEPWHWEYDHQLDRHYDTEDDDMWTDDDRAKLNALVEVVFAGGAGTPKDLTLYQRAVRTETNTTGLPIVLTGIQQQISTVLQAILDAQAADDTATKALAQQLTELAGVVYIGTPGTPKDDTEYQRVRRIAAKLGVL